MLIFRGSGSRCSPVRLPVDQSRFLFKDSSYMNRLYLYPSLQYRLLNLIDVKCGDVNPSKLVKLRQLFFSDSGAATNKLTPLVAPHQQKGAMVEMLETTNHMQTPLMPHASQFSGNCILTLHNLIIWICRRYKKHHKSKLVRSSSPNFKVKIPNPKYNLKQNLYINMYREPKWGPLFCLEFRPSFWRIQPPKTKDKKVPFRYIYLDIRETCYLSTESTPVDLDPWKTVWSIPWETKRNERAGSFEISTTPW